MDGFDIVTRATALWVAHGQIGAKFDWQDFHISCHRLPKLLPARQRELSKVLTYPPESVCSPFAYLSLPCSRLVSEPVLPALR